MLLQFDAELVELDGSLDVLAEGCMSHDVRLPLSIAETVYQLFSRD
jgi:hypothetical protein